MPLMSPSPRYFLIVLLARKKLVLGMSTLVLLTVIVGSFLMTPTYESSIKVLLRRERTDPVVSPEATSSPTSIPPEVSEAELNSEVELLTSRPLLSEVARTAGLDEGRDRGRFSFSGWIERIYRQFHQQPSVHPTDQAVDLLRQRLKVIPIKKSNVIEVRYRASDPQAAARVLNVLSQLYIDHHIKLRQAATAAAFYSEQAEALRQKLEEVESELRTFELRHGLATGEEQESLALQKLSEFKAQLGEAQVDLQGSVERLHTLEALLAAQPERITKETRTTYHKGLDLLRQKLGELELRQAETRQKYKPSSRMVRQIEEQVATLRQYLENVDRQPTREVAEGVNELYLALKNDLMRTRAEVAMQRERVNALARLVQSYEKGLREYRKNSYQQRSLSRVRDVIEKTYVAYLKKAMEARLAQALDRQKIVNVSIAEPAIPNYRPVSPNLFLNGILGLVVGLFSSVAMAFGLEYAERPVRTGEIVERQLQLKVLAALPEKS
ncbi:MAG: hypothetical protein D6723_19940 [Acidobacteria bacterium]|nr:MAG: hypothetical protein D6723_19940 [Acidobacteriota bacterium]